MVLVSGAGSGIGRAIAVEQARRHYGVILLGRTESKLAETRGEMLNPTSHLLIVADVMDKSSIRAGLSEIGLESLDAVIANAGIGGGNVYGTEDRWEEIISTNLTGVYILVNEAMPYLKMKRDEFRHVVIMSSILARLGTPGYSAYCASKAGLLGLMRSWAAELAQDKILVNAICPGRVETDMARQGIEAYRHATGKSYEEALQEQMSFVPLRKMSQPGEIAKMVNYLLSDNQTSITGQAFDINNGAMMPS